MRTSPERMSRQSVRLAVIPLILIAITAVIVHAQTVSVVQTNPDQSALFSPQAPLSFLPGTGTQLAINVDDTIRYQRLEGVGASFTDSSAYLVWNKLTPSSAPT